MVIRRRLLANEPSPEDIRSGPANDFSNREMPVPASYHLYLPAGLGFIYCRSSLTQVESHHRLMASMCLEPDNAVCVSDMSAIVRWAFFSPELDYSSFKTLASAERLFTHFLFSLWGWIFVPRVEHPESALCFS